MGKKDILKSRKVKTKGMLKKNPNAIWILSIATVLYIIFNLSESEGAEFSLNPSIVVREEYDDNIYFRKDNRVDDYITRVMPSVSLYYRTPILDFNSDYTLNWWYYSKRGESDTSHSLTLISKINMIKNFLYLDISDTYTSVVLEPREPSTESNLERNRTDSNTLNISPYMRYAISASNTFSAGYRYTNIWYERDGTDRQMHTGFANIRHVFSSMLNASLGGEYTADRPYTEHKNDQNNDQTALFFGVSYNTSPKIVLDGTVGYRWINYFHGRDEDSIFYKTGLSYRFSEAGQIEARFSSSFTNSPLYGLIKSQTENLSVKYGRVLSVNGNMFHRKEKYSEVERKDDAIGGSIGFEYKPTFRLTLSISGRHEQDKFLPEGERKKLYGASGGINYRLTDKTAVSTSYTYTKEDYKKNMSDYTDNFVMAQIRTSL
jgi:hypothetical protein